MTKFIGFHTDDALPIKRGDTVTILKGTPIRHNGKDHRAGRTYKVKVDHVLNGCTDTHSDHARKVNMSNPCVRWAGTGSYWSAVDINLIPEAGATCDWCENRPPTCVVELYPACEQCRKELLE